MEPPHAEVHAVFRFKNLKSWNYFFERNNEITAFYQGRKQLASYHVVKECLRIALFTLQHRPITVVYSCLREHTLQHHPIMNAYCCLHERWPLHKTRSPAYIWLGGHQLVIIYWPIYFEQFTYDERIFALRKCDYHM